MGTWSREGRGGKGTSARPAPSWALSLEPIPPPPCPPMPWGCMDCGLRELAQVPLARRGSLVGCDLIKCSFAFLGDFLTRPETVGFHRRLRPPKSTVAFVDYKERSQRFLGGPWSASCLQHCRAAAGHAQRPPHSRPGGLGGRWALRGPQQRLAD